MKFPSVQTLTRSIGLTIKRFPLVILFAILACIISSRVNHLAFDGGDTQYYLYNIVQCCYLGMLLTLVTAIFAECNRMTMARRAVIDVVAVGLIVAYYYSLPDHVAEINIQRFLLFVVALHLLIAFVPFIGRTSMNGFWQYNKTLFLRILMTGLYSTVLFIGLYLAMVAIDQLFKADINYKWYLDLWIWIAGLFNTVFFLAGFPENYGELEEKTDYPKGLKIFTQYVLLPIITIYLLILYAYMFKIIFNRQWPFGWVSYLVLGFAIAGILSLLLIHPIRNEENNKWIPGFSRFFYFAICPLIVLLFLAIERRIGEYGITGERYFVLALALWLAFIALTFLLSKKKNIKLIPVTLCLLAFLSSFGPWGAFSVSRNSQTRRLKQFLDKNGLLSGGKIVPLKRKLSGHDNLEISSIVQYLVNTHGYETLQPLFSPNLDSMMKADGNTGSYAYYMQGEKLLAYMGIDERSGYDSVSNAYFGFNSNEEKNGIVITGYDYLIDGYSENTYSRGEALSNNYLTGNVAVRVDFDPESGNISLKAASDTPIRIDVMTLAKSLDRNTYTRYSKISPDSMTIRAENNELSAKFMFSHIEGKRTSDAMKINSVQANILLKFKHAEGAKTK